MKNKDDLIAFGITMAAFAVIGVAAMFAPKTTSPVKKRRALNMDYVEAEQRFEGGHWMWHIYYDDGVFEYETSDYTYSDALQAMKKLVEM